MGKLIKANFFRVLKSKLLIISLIIAVALPIFTVLMFKGLEVTMGDALEGVGAAIGAGGARNLLGTSYNLSNNLGLIIPIFAGVFVVTDFTSGCLRNKIIAGQKRGAIYLSHLIVASIYAVVLVTIYALITLGFGSLILGYAETIKINGGEIWYLVKLFISGTLTFIFVASLSTLIAMSTRSLPLTIILSLTAAIIIGVITQILALTIQGGDPNNIEKFAGLIPSYSATKIDTSDTVFIEGLISCTLFTTLNTVLGIILFKNKDVK